MQLSVLKVISCRERSLGYCVSLHKLIANSQKGALFLVFIPIPVTIVYYFDVIGFTLRNSTD